MKKLLIILLLIPSIANAKTVKSDLAQKARERCKNWETLEKVPHEEAIRCLKTIIARMNEQEELNRINIQQIYNSFGR